MGTIDKILILLRDRPGLKAQEIAGLLGLDRSEVNSELYSNKGKVRRDGSYSWWLKDDSLALVSLDSKSSEVIQPLMKVLCPKCRSPMVQRTAKRGSNSGRSFFGCSRYPRCKEILQLPESISTDSVNQDPLRPEAQHLSFSFPRTLVARSLYPGYQVKFLETATATQEFVKKVHYGEYDDHILREFSQWRVDYPINDSAILLSQRQSNVIAVMDKILLRGRITLPSPRIEKALGSLFAITPNILDSAIVSKEIIACFDRKREVLPWLDSEEEKIFYSELLPLLMGDNYQRFVMPQVEIASLLMRSDSLSTTGEQRVDFVIFHPQIDVHIVVEIDGPQHNSSDDKRDQILQVNGYFVLRIPTSEVRERKGPKLDELRSMLLVIYDEYVDNALKPIGKVTKFAYSLRIAHQIQVVILQAIQIGLLDIAHADSWSIITDLDHLGLFDEGESLTIVRGAVEDFLELMNHVCTLYSCEIISGSPHYSLSSGSIQDKFKHNIGISFAAKLHTGSSIFHVQPIYLPFHLAHQSFPSSILGKIEEFQTEDLEYFLQYIFRKSSFWEGQVDGIARALKCQDALVLLPPGAGKSLVYQLASMLLPGVTIVIDPLISLMDDQIDNLSLVGIDRCIAITSQMEDVANRVQAMLLFGQGEYIFAFISPERFQIIDFRNSIRALTIHTPFSLIVVDEAHCVSEWGHDFRTAYLNIGRTTREYCGSNKRVPPLLALTGTASRAVLKDVQRELQISDWNAIITPKSFDRKELNFRIIIASSHEKASRLKGYLGQMLPSLFNVTAPTLYQVRGEGTYSGLIFCPNVGGSYGVEKVSSEIRKDLRISTEIFSGKHPKNWSPIGYLRYKSQVTKSFKRNKIPILVCTKAFGMGIDKPNIRYTVHYGVPGSIESFYQEAGRAGRNRQIAHCAILFSNDDPERTSRLLDPNTTVEQVNQIVSSTSYDENDDITRILYFHIGSFKGIQQEKMEVEQVFQSLGDLSKKGDVVVPIPDSIKAASKDKDDAKKTTEKALHRLLLIGVISDYTIEYSRNEFNVKKAGASKEKIIESYGQYVTGYIVRMGKLQAEQAEME